MATTTSAVADSNARPQANIKAPSSKAKDLYPMSNWKYDAFIHVMSLLADLFFREVHPRGSWRVPRHGPVLFVAAPHANQFVDAVVLQKVLRNEAGRRVSLLIAQKSVHGFIGWASRQVGSVPVGRAQDAAKPAQGMIYLPDPIGDPTLVRGVGTKFGQGEGQVGGMIFLPSGQGKTGASVDILSIISPEEVRVKRPFLGKLAMEQLTGRDDVDEDGNFTSKEFQPVREGFNGTKFKLAPRMDQTKVYEAVFNRLRSGGCVGLFPEGGSHDRTDLLPLKAGVAIMALGTLAEAPECGLKIVPIGMNYFHAHKFRSRAVVEFGAPMEVPPELVELYKDNKRREAITPLVDQVYQALDAVTMSTPDYDTLMLIQAARRLYNPVGKKLPLPVVVELNRRLAKGYEKYKNDERIVKLSESVKDYNKQLRYLNLRDHQVQYANMSSPRVLFTFFSRTMRLLLLLVAVLPGTILFSPIFVATKMYSKKKAREALAGSAVKIQGRDVMATWKILVSMGLAPVMYNLYSILITLKIGSDRLWGYVPSWVTWYMVFPAAWIFFPAITFAALRFGEVGMDIFKSLRPLVLCLSPTSSYSIHQLRERREQLSQEVTDMINILGPEIFPDFEAARLVHGPRERADASKTSPPTTPGFKRRRSSDMSISSDGTIPTPCISRRNTMQSSRAIPHNESFSNIGKIPMFSTRPPSRSRSRSSSGGGGLGFGFTTLDSHGGLDEAGRRIREAMRERGQMRRRRSARMRIGAEDSDEDAEGEEWEEARKKNF